MSRHVRIALTMWPAVLGALLVLLLNRFEHSFMPVVSDFTATKITRTGDVLTASGYMRKDRACVFAGITAEGRQLDGGSVDVPLIFRDGRQDTAARPTGTQSWGPWVLEIPVAPEIKTVSLTAVHKCHPFWSMLTPLITIPVVLEAPK